MHISKLRLVNYRNFANSTFIFKKGVNTIIGENGSGKTNLFRAIRLLLDDHLLRAAHKLDELDFHRGLSSWRGHWIIVSLEFEDIGEDEAIQALFQHSAGVIPDGGLVARATYTLIFRPKKDIRLKLAQVDDGDHTSLEALRKQISITDYETLFTGRSDIDFCDPVIYKELVGDFDNCIIRNEVDDQRIGARLPVYLSVSQEVSFTFIQALRDVVSEFHNNRTNPLLNLLKIKSGEIAPAVLQPIVEKVVELNNAIENLNDVQVVRSNIRDTIKDAAGETYSPRALSIRSELPAEADKLFQSLRLFVGESEENYEGAVHELSLGGANLIYLTLKLLEFKYQQAHQSIANFLIIEEPEAHIHTHIQKALFDRIAYADTQIIYSTHSTHISEVSNIENVNILGRRGIVCESFQPATGLSPEQVGTLQRYLDAVRSNLLFAKSVVLVEGDAEEVLVPALFKAVIGLSLDELGVSLINIRSTGFQNVAVIFNDDRVRKRCSIITDLDAAFIDTTPNAGDSSALASSKQSALNSQTVGAQRKVALDEFVKDNPWLSVYYADHTFEVDFIAAGNGDTVKKVVSQVYVKPATINVAEAELISGRKELFGPRVLTMAKNKGKGWFAILLSNQISHKTVIPNYIRDAIFFARPSLSRELFFNIFKYRVQRALLSQDIPQVVADIAISNLQDYRNSAIDLLDIKEKMRVSLPGDQIHDILAPIV
jgi:putative ATP-dependent endonuclease of the OLD family